ncbi:MAG: DNA repair protein RecO [Dysgonamonadaceae bacterium]|jgi:DNA repair protein RecO (recombination protein O)|nr:DNA repair protein RecO [Dysgonamonadaceae bacterium]
MQHKTQGIVLNVARYNDRFSIVHIFTRDFGRVSYLLPKTTGKRSKMKTALFFPLSLLNLETEHLPLRELQRLEDAEQAFPLHDLCTSVSKVATAIFLSEFLSRVLRETNENPQLYEFLHHSIILLETTDKGFANFHLAFMAGLTRFLGIFPNTQNYTAGAYFDLLNGEFTPNVPFHTHYLSKQQSLYLCHFRRINYHNMQLFRLSQANRNAIIDFLLTYYRLHTYDFPPLKSLDVLREVMGGEKRN